LAHEAGRLREIPTHMSQGTTFNLRLHAFQHECSHSIPANRKRHAKSYD
jgi:hypothetical protein